MYEAKVLADSVSPQGVRLTTLEVTFPRFVLAEQNTHRQFSRNTASSRAIPVKTRCDMIEANPFVPEAFGKNKKGMQSDELLDSEANAEAQQIWREAAADAVRHARRMEKIGVHKQYANRLAETFAWVTQIVTATEWDNYMNLRCHVDAQPEIEVAAQLMRKAMGASEPRELRVGWWHLPLVTDTERDGLVDLYQDGTYTERELVKCSVGRCAAVSFEKHTLQKALLEEIERHGRLLTSGHMSPFEHQARVADEDEILKYALFRWDEQKMVFVPSMIGNFKTPWLQYRKTIPGEAVFGTPI